MKKSIPIFVITGLLALASPRASAETYKFDAAHSSISFSVRQFINVTHGRFKQFSGTIELDREHPERSSVTARITVRSIDTGIRRRDDHLLSDEFFNAAKFPEITFKSRAVRRTGPQQGDVEGDLTMHGVTRPIVLHVELATPLRGDQAISPSRWVVRTDPLKRRDFNLLFGSTAEAISGISQEVAVKIEVEAAKAE